MASARRTKSFLLAAAFVAGTALLTACQNDTADSGSVSTGNTGAAGAAVAADSKTGGGKTAGAKGGKGVSGTFAGGLVEYLAPGKYIVSVSGKDQQFFVAEDTKVYGGGVICGKYSPTPDAVCTTDQLEKSLKDGSIAADVVMKDGVATKVTERPAPDEGPAVDDSEDGSASGDRETAIEGINKGKGVSGTWFGTVSYLAPGKFTVSDMKGVEQQFFVAEDTKIWGTGDICGDEDGQAATQCTEGELESATKGAGVSAEVKISNGIATSITDDH
ncbi:hypothetical protein ACIHCQ_34855 [Streptomyces sp. NPDC052236]|uniref:hypothetical protein n=1 Tax=Streptomyces sp. NPDC052236 TaxID=3365686 RepID=UPI0037CDB0CF